MTFRSDPSKVIGTLMCLEMGLRIVEFLDPFSFTAVSTLTGEIISFHTSIQPINKDYTLYIDNDKHDFYVIVIEGKKGDNSILIKHNGIKGYNGQHVSYEFIADKIKKKWRYEFT